MTSKCENGVDEENSAHEFTDVVNAYQTLIYCRRCGEMRPLETPQTRASVSEAGANWQKQLDAAHQSRSNPT